MLALLNRRRFPLCKTLVQVSQKIFDGFDFSCHLCKFFDNAKIAPYSQKNEFRNHCEISV